MSTLVNLSEVPKRRTLRRVDRTPLEGDYDVVICGASFAGLSVARELTGSGARVLLLDRYEIGERQTSACAAPSEWLAAMGVDGTILQTFEQLIIHTPHGTTRFDLPWTFSTFDYPELCRMLFSHCDAEFEIAAVSGRGSVNGLGPTVATDRGEVAAPLLVDCAGWRSVLRATGPQPPNAYLSRGLEVSPPGASADLEVWIDRSLVPAGYGWNFPAAGELRVGIGSYNPRHHVREPTGELARRLGIAEAGYHGNWIPHKLNVGTEDGVFFAGDAAGHCMPLTAEGIRTAFYFGIACGRELRRVVEGRTTRETALRRYEAFCGRHDFPFKWMLRVQNLIPKLPPRLLDLAVRASSTQGFVDWSFGHYLKVAHHSFAVPGRQRVTTPRLARAA